MQVSVETSGAIERKLTVSIPHAEVDRKIAARLREVGRGARIPGFRPGKAPPHIIAKRYGGQVTNEVVSDTINASYREALGQENLQPAGLLSLQPKPFVAGDDLQYVATVELFPEIPPPTLAGRTIEKPVCEVTDADVDRALESIRKRHADFVARGPGEGAQDGDRLSVDSCVRADGRTLAGGAARDHQFILGDGLMLAALEAGLRGVAAGETRRIPLTMPADYPLAEAAGKAVEFEVTVKTLERPVLADLDDAFAEKLGVTEGGMAKMRAEVKRRLEEGAALGARSELRKRVLDALLEANPIESPSVLVEAEIEQRARMLSRDDGHARRGRDHGRGRSRNRDGEPSLPPGIDRDMFRPGATRQVALSLIIHEVIERNELQPDAEAVRQRVTEIAGSGEQAEAMLNWYYADPERLRPVESTLLEDMVVERMLETATVVEKPLSFQQLQQIAEQ